MPLSQAQLDDAFREYIRNGGRNPYHRFAANLQAQYQHAYENEVITNQVPSDLTITQAVDFQDMFVGGRGHTYNPIRNRVTYVAPSEAQQIGTNYATADMWHDLVNTPPHRRGSRNNPFTEEEFNNHRLTYHFPESQATVYYIDNADALWEAAASTDRQTNITDWQLRQINRTSNMTIHRQATSIPTTLPKDKEWFDINTFRFKTVKTASIIKDDYANFFKIEGTTLTIYNIIDKNAQPLAIYRIKEEETDKVKEFLKAAIHYFITATNGASNELYNSTYNIRDKSSTVIGSIALPDGMINRLVELQTKRTTSAIRGSYKPTARETFTRCFRDGNYSNFMFNMLDHSSRDIMHSVNENALNALQDFANGKTEQLIISHNSMFRNNMLSIFNEFSTMSSFKYRTRKEHYTISHIKDSNKHLTIPKSVVSKLRTEFNSFTSGMTTSINQDIIITKLKIEPVNTVSINIDTIYPDLQDNLTNYASLHAAYMPVRDKKTLANTLLHVGSMFNNIWEAFNKIKCGLMFNGYTELNAVKYIIDNGLKSTYNNHATYNNTMDYTIAKCDITGQLMPSIYTVLVRMYDDSIKTISAYHIIYNGNAQVARYEMVTGNPNYYYREIKIKDSAFYLHSVYNHTRNALEYLTPKASRFDNTTVFDDVRVYNPIPYMGVELEVERKVDEKDYIQCPETITESVLDALGRDFVILKADGSLRDYRPFEIVTVPATLQAHKDNWAKFMNDNKLKGYLSSYSNGHCGMHVHISRAAFTGLHLAKFMRFINLPTNGGFITQLAQRKSGYAKFTNYDNNDKLAITHHANAMYGGLNSHYDAVNTANRDTIEVRIFRGNLAKSHFFKNLEFVHALWAYTKDCSMKQLTYTDFIFWLFKDNCKLYTNLHQWLIAAGYNVSNKNDATKDEKQAINKVRLVVNKKFNTKSLDKMKKIGKDSYINANDIIINNQ